MIMNKFRVPIKQWNRWNELGRKTFNFLFEMMKDNQHTFLHPKQEVLSVRKWRTVCWNASWIAADCASGREDGYHYTE